MEFPIDRSVITQAQAELNIKNLANASIRDLVALVNLMEKKTGQKYVRMEMGVPGLPSPRIAIEAEHDAMERGVSAVYPNLDGLPELKYEISRFVKLFINIDVKPANCVPTVGAMQGAFASFLVANRTHADRAKGTLFIDPGFNMNKLQVRILQQPFETFDVYDYRGAKLRDKLESYLSTGQFQTILYSNPNNPTWQCFTEEELRIIGEVATKYDVVVMEDLAYFGMDFRHDYSRPGVPPYQPTVAHYTDNWMMLISSSKAFSYAGQRAGMIVVSPKLFDRTFPDLEKTFGRSRFGEALVSSALYALSSGVAHSVQWGLAAVLKAANDGEYNFVEPIREYGRKAHIVKKMFTDNGFHIVYDADGGVPIADGFYFTVGYDHLDSERLLELFLMYGLCAITLDTTGSERQGVMRICISLLPESQFGDLEKRLILMNNALTE
ncbi:pyridoxal phosphate-dependent aminotransferase [Porphyromonas pogonae]|uniref:pyridoxal phosphate-dependent aminotransferase n=1 Tax=Porphyromonas pogonae TaxID=867595 RepID=UPI002E7695AF|nr:pyridoxal phosphate-dependent aminotransferase [Porphyromonas pogonae]